MRITMGRIRDTTPSEYVSNVQGTGASDKKDEDEK
jgi:hypothetical protein